jgi:hypothetical protein
MTNTNSPTTETIGNIAPPTNSNSPSGLLNARPSSRSTTGKKKNGNSRFSKKNRSKKPAATPTPTNTYLSSCCSLPASKPRAFSAVVGSKDKSGLGHWRCTGCKKTCKVSISKYQAPESSEVKLGGIGEVTNV